jgi:hypothetical protein
MADIDNIVKVEIDRNPYVPYEVHMPYLADIEAIATKDVESYRKPAYQHYNWCCEQLGLNEKKVKYPDVKLDREAWNEVQELMVKACIKYLQENNIELIETE